MKCNCGYEDTYNWETNTRLGDKEFIASELNIPYETEGNYYSHIISKTVYICPKCGTLLIDL